MRLIHRVDDAVYAVERVFVVVAMALMVLMVFFEVVDRRLEAPESKLAGLMAALHVPAPDKTGPMFGVAVLIFLLWFGLATLRRRDKALVPRWAEPISALAGAGVAWTLGWIMIHQGSNVFYSAVWALVSVAVIGSQLRKNARVAGLLALLAVVGGVGLYLVIPEGYSWAKEIAMLLLVWTGLVGASMASHQGRHIDIDFGKKMFPKSLHKPLTLLAALVAASFAALLFVIGVVYVFGERGLYRLEGHMQHTGLPDWILGLAIPWTFAFITLRALILVARIAGGDLTAKGSSPTVAPKALGEH